MFSEVSREKKKISNSNQISINVILGSHVLNIVIDSIVYTDYILYGTRRKLDFFQTINNDCDGIFGRKAGSWFTYTAICEHVFRIMLTEHFFSSFRFFPFISRAKLFGYASSEYSLVYFIFAHSKHLFFYISLAYMVVRYICWIYTPSKNKKNVFGIWKEKIRR